MREQMNGISNQYLTSTAETVFWIYSLVLRGAYIVEIEYASAEKIGIALCYLKGGLSGNLTKLHMAKPYTCVTLVRGFLEPIK